MRDEVVEARYGSRWNMPNLAAGLPDGAHPESSIERVDPRADPPIFFVPLLLSESMSMLHSHAPASEPTGSFQPVVSAEEKVVQNGR